MLRRQLMYRVLIADDDYEDRELLKLEIERALEGQNESLKFMEAVSVKQALQRLGDHPFDLLTLDIEFDRLNEGLEVLPEIFEKYPVLNIIVISGKLDKAEVTSQLFRFTKDNVLKSKRWARHFDVLDKKDDKNSAIKAAYDFALKQSDSVETVRDLFVLAESLLEKGEVEKCLDVYRKIQELAPGEHESRENLNVLKDGGYEQALEYFRKGEKIVAGLLLGHFLEIRLKAYAKRTLGRYHPALSECIKELEKSRKASPYKRSLFRKLVRSRNKIVHHPETINEDEFGLVNENLKILETRF
jgi:CheY-like chemotaxis protein